MAMQRIVVVGTSGAGKTTVARALSERLGVPHIELDALHWTPGWTETPTDVFRARVSRALEPAAWVVDGNYAKARDLIWPLADTIVWLDYSLPTVLWQVIVRTIRRMIAREELWHGNREQLRMAFGRDSIVLWALRTHRKNRQEYLAALGAQERGHLSVVRLPSPRSARAWLRSIARGGARGAL
jgi:adenylate kinase family enzyme